MIDGGAFAVTIDGTLIDEHFFGATNDIKRSTLSGSFTPAAAGLYTLRIENTRTEPSSYCLFNYIDNISLLSQAADFFTDIRNIPCATGGTAGFTLDAGILHGGEDYWIWMSAGGTWPGIALNAVEVPLNWDPLFAFGLVHPGFPGSTEFLGTLDANGKAAASLVMPPDTSKLLVGICLNFAYVLTSPGPSMPVTYASFPVHLKYIP